MGCGVGDPPNAKTIIKKKKKIFAEQVLRVAGRFKFSRC